MFTVSSTGILILLVVFIIFLIKAYIEDSEYVEKIKEDIESCPACRFISMRDITDPKYFHRSVVETMKYENKYGQFADSKVKKMLSAARDQIIRGIIMGALDGNASSALQGAITWSLSGGIVSGISDIFGWKSKFY